jgi:hypothetical protein
VRPARHRESAILFWLGTATVFVYLLAYDGFARLVAAEWPALMMLLPRLLVPQFRERGDDAPEWKNEGLYHAGLSHQPESLAGYADGRIPGGRA